MRLVKPNEKNSYCEIRNRIRHEFIDFLPKNINNSFGKKQLELVTKMV